MQSGKIGVTTENIFPVIKKFLYSDQEIFLRELVSNAVDATQKLKTLAKLGKYDGDVTNANVSISIDEKAKTITISDKGIGMTAEEIDKYINQIAFSGAEEFLDKYKDKAEAIIGHFGLGFYSAFMVSESVDIITKSYQKDAKSVKWSCDGSPNYSLEEVEKAEVGTDIVLHIDKESEEYLQKNRIEELLKKYCKFLPITIVFGKKQEWKDGKYVDTDQDNVINNTEPAWTKKPADLKDDDYQAFYKELYPMAEDPLFNIHLNVDYPFHLTGILYFPKIRNNFEVQKNKIQLYSNQVFVTDSVEGIVPDFLTLLHGVLDSPDIPLNVSRSYLQSDNNVKKISSHITKKVSDRLQEIFKNNREEYEKKWDDLKLFITYGMLSEEKFYDRAKDFALFKNVDGKYFTFEDYKTLISANQTDKNGTLVYLYATDPETQYSYIQKAKNKGYDVLLLDGHLDAHLISQLEQKFEKCLFSRVDADIVENLIKKDDLTDSKLSQDDTQDLTEVFSSQAGQNLLVQFANLNADEAPIMVTESEYMRRMKDMAQMNPGMSFYSQMPDNYNLVVNANHPLIAKINDDKVAKTKDALDKINADLKPLEDERKKLDDAKKDKKEDEIPVTDKEALESVTKQIADLESKKKQALDEYAKGNQTVKQLIDLALISNNMLKGEALESFVKRSVEML